MSSTQHKSTQHKQSESHASRPSRASGRGGRSGRERATTPTGLPACAAAVSAAAASAGCQVWFVGDAARAAVGPYPLADRPELLTDASGPTLETLRAALDEQPVAITPLDEQSLEAALAARGLTADAFAVTPDGEVIDPHSGIRHLNGRVIRTVAPPENAFRELPILLMRVSRLISWTGAAPSSEVRRYGSRDAGNILDVPERSHAWGVEMNAVLLGVHIDAAMQWLQDTRVLAFAMPEIAAMVGFDKSCSVHHKDIWDHTKKVTQKAARDLVVRWAALCHDIGKVWTRSVNRQGKVHFFRHEEHGALLFESIAHRMALDPVLTHRVSYLIENHSRVNLYQDDWTDSAVRRLIRDTEGHLDDLLTFSKADFTTTRKSRIDEMQRQMSALEARIDAIRIEDAKQPPLLKGVGDAIMTRFSLRPSRAIGDLKTLLEAEVEAGNLPERSEAYEVYLDWLQTNPAAQDVIAAAPKVA